MTTTTVTTTALSAARVASALDLLEGAAASLVEASHAGQITERYAEAHLAALRAAAAVLAAHPPRAGGGSPRNIWELVPAIAPELVEWAEFFAYSSRRRWAIADGIELATAREADDLLRAAADFLELVRGTLGLPPRAGRSSAPLRLTPAG
ncbi:MAG: SAV_6107 family HEPN domain-containing protein [Tetrasphaera sp.]